MDAVPDETTHGTGRLAAWVEDGATRGRGPDRVHWRAVLARAAARPVARKLNRRPAAVGAVGLTGAGILAILAGARPELGGHEVAALLPALLAACAPAAFCLRLALAPPGLRTPAGSVAERQAELAARERLLFEQVAAVRRANPAGDASAGAGGRAPMRRHGRIKPHRTRTSIAVEDGRRLNAQIVDVSQSGVAVEGNLPGLWVGAMVTVGSRRAKAVRALPRGMAFEFSTPIAAEALTVDLVL